MKKIFILFAAALTIGLTGCQSFLEEETYGSTTEIFKEENGIKALVYQSYTKINNLYGGDGQWPLMTELGTDIYLRGKNQGDVGLCDYYGLDATNGNVAWLWNHCYKALFNINLFFETIDQTPFADEDEKSQFKAEMYVMRALFLWIVTETWGDSYLPMTTDETEGTEARRSPARSSTKRSSAHSRQPSGYSPTRAPRNRGASTCPQPRRCSHACTSTTNSGTRPPTWHRR